MTNGKIVEVSTGKNNVEDTEDEEGVKTKMYNNPSSPSSEKSQSLVVPKQEGGEKKSASSMDIWSDAENYVDEKLRERRERLERAAKLLSREREVKEKRIDEGKVRRDGR